MVPLSTAIHELNAGKIEFATIDGCCTTEGEVVTYLKRLEEFESIELEPEEIVALKAQQEAEKNEPLTLEELRMMDGQPVYVTQPGHESSWALVYGFWTEKDVIYLTFFQGASALVELLLHRGAKIYRRPPKEASGT